MFDEVRKCPFIFSDETDQSYDCVGYLIEKYKENIKPLGQGSSQLNKAPVGVGVRNHFFENGKMRIEAVVLGAGGGVDVKVANGSVFDVGDDVYTDLRSGEAVDASKIVEQSGYCSVYRIGMVLREKDVNGFLRIVSCVPEEV